MRGRGRERDREREKKRTRGRERKKERNYRVFERENEIKKVKSLVTFVIKKTRNIFIILKYSV